MGASDVELRRPGIGERIRFAIEYGGQWRPLVWMRVGKDGSIYVGLLSGRPTSFKVYAKPAARLIQISRSELAPTPVPKSSRVSFHPSGEVHVGDRTGWTERRWTELAPPLQLQLCLMVFMHPARYPPRQGRGKNDFDVHVSGYKVDEGRPMYGAAFVGVWKPGLRPPVRLPSMTESRS